MKSEISYGRQRLVVGALIGSLTSLPVIALSYLGAKLAELPFVPFDVFDWMARFLPGYVIKFGIDAIVRTIELLGLGRISGTAKNIEQLTGVLIIVIAGAVFGLSVAWSESRSHWSGAAIGTAFGALAFAMLALIEITLGSSIATHVVGSLLWLAILFVGWGTLLGVWLATPELSAASHDAAVEYAASRRVFLTKLVGGSIGLAVVASGVGKVLQAQQDASGAGQALTTVASQPNDATNTPAASQTPSAMMGEAAVRDRVAAAPGTRPEITANNDFYRTDIDSLPLYIDKASWKLQVSGLFDRPRTLTMADLLAYPAVTQPITLSCISNPIGGDLISTSNWVGVRIRDVLYDLGLRPAAKELAIKAADGYYESVGMQDLMDPRTLLVYGMNGETLPAVHGFPLRIYIPNRYGMKQPKWITSIEATSGEGPGYWVDRGWSATAYPQIISVIDTIAKDKIENGLVPIGGIAWAGDRGIKKVEIQVDGGQWVEATLRTPPLSQLTWVQWRYDWQMVRGSHTFQVRATDGTGKLQTASWSDTYPDGARGLHSLRVTI